MSDVPKRRWKVWRGNRVVKIDAAASQTVTHGDSQTTCVCGHGLAVEGDAACDMVVVAEDGELHLAGRVWAHRRALDGDRQVIRPENEHKTRQQRGLSATDVTVHVWGYDEVPLRRRPSGKLEGGGGRGAWAFAGELKVCERARL